MPLLTPAPTVVATEYVPFAVGLIQMWKPVSLLELSAHPSVILVRSLLPTVRFDGAIGSRPGVVAVAMFDQAELVGAPSDRTR